MQLTKLFKSLTTSAFLYWCIFLPGSLIFPAVFRNALYKSISILISPLKAIKIYSSNYSSNRLTNWSTNLTTIPLKMMFLTASPKKYLSISVAAKLPNFLCRHTSIINSRSYTSILYDIFYASCNCFSQGCTSWSIGMLSNFLIITMNMET